MIAANPTGQRTGQRTAQLIVYVADEPIDDATVAQVKDEIPGAMILADLLEPLYDSSIPTREAARTLGRVKSELESMVESGTRVVLVCRRRLEDLGTRSHFLASICAAADRVHFLRSTYTAPPPPSQRRADVYAMTRRLILRVHNQR